MYQILFILLLLIFTCRHYPNKARLLLEQSPTVDYQSKAYFSYPGKYADPAQKKEVTNVIVDLIHNTKQSLEIYAYSLNNPEVVFAIENAVQRGVQVRIMGDSDKDYTMLKERGISVHIWKTTGLHHIKVIYSDRKLLFTGTGNFSMNGLTKDWNGYLLIKVPPEKSEDLYLFLEEKYTLPVFELNGFYFYNSPEYGVVIQSELLKEVEKAKKTIHYLIFDHYDPILSHALRKASQRGVQVIGVYDDPVDPEGEYLQNEFFNNQSKIYKDGNMDILEESKGIEGGLLHHKTMIIDNELVLTGSFNFSASARDKNREIFIKTRLPHIVNAFIGEFNRVHTASYQQSQNQFYENVNSISTNYELTEDELCLSSNTLTSPLVELGSGIFHTYLYYPNIKYERCVDRNGYYYISTGISNYKLNLFLDEDKYWENPTWYERNTDKKFLSNQNSSSLFYTNKFIQLHSPILVSISTDNHLQFQSNQDTSPMSGQLLSLEKTLKPIQFMYNSSSGQYISDIELSEKDIETGLVFIEFKNTIDLFCYKQSLKSIDPAFKYILSKVYIDNLEKGQILDKPYCMNY